MLQLLAGTDAGKGLVRFERHRPEQTLLYKLCLCETRRFHSPISLG